MHGDETPVADLVRDARAGRSDAWDALVERYTPLVVSVIRRYRLQGSDLEDVVQTLWLRLVEHLGDIREPQALPGWIVTTVRNECLGTLRQRQRTRPFDPLAAVGELELTGPVSVDGAVAVDVGVVDGMAESGRHEVLLQALAELPDNQRRLLLLLVTDPPLSYGEISSRLGIPIGSIGPTRARALQRIRQHHAVAAWAAANQAEDVARS
jgi:RNA polymerase sigma factor (sigma-70 family)